MLSKSEEQLLGLLTVPVPSNEAERLRVLRQSTLLDSKSEERFDRLTTMAARIFKVPISLISLVDLDRQWFKSKYGLDTTQTHRNAAFCSYLMSPESSEVLVVEDSHEDERFKNNALVTGPPYIRLYAGAALIVDGVRIGTLCVIDTEPRKGFLMRHKIDLLDIAWMVSQEIQQDLNKLKLQREHSPALMMHVIQHISLPLDSTSSRALTMRDRNTFQSSEVSKSLQQVIDEIDDIKETFDYVQRFYTLLNNIKEANSAVTGTDLLTSLLQEAPPPATSSTSLALSTYGCQISSLLELAEFVIINLFKLKDTTFTINNEFDVHSVSFSYPDILSYVILAAVADLHCYGGQINIKVGYSARNSRQEGSIIVRVSVQTGETRPNRDQDSQLMNHFRSFKTDIHMGELLDRIGASIQWTESCQDCLLASTSRQIAREFSIPCRASLMSISSKSKLTNSAKKCRVLIIQSGNNDDFKLDKLIEQFESRSDCELVLSKTHAEGVKLLNTVAFGMAFLSIHKVNKYLELFIHC